MRRAVLVTGPNASGKTTATREGLAPWAHDPRVVAIYADNSDRSRFNGSMGSMVVRMTEIYLGATKLLVVEGTNRIATVLARVVAAHPESRFVEMHSTYVSGAFMGKAIADRCAKLGKRFRDDYWTERVLHYESQLRYKNIAENHYGGHCTWWPISEGYVGQAALTDYIRSVAQATVGDPQNEEPVDLFQLGY